jgi:hypothetical protein
MDRMSDAPNEPSENISVASEPSFAKHAVAGATSTRVSRQSEYAAFITSDAWRNGEARQAELVTSGHRCRGCNLGADEIELQVHHRSYANFRNEVASDLTTLCVECHTAITNVIRRRRYCIDPVWLVQNQSSAEDAPSLNDLMRSGGRA